MALLSRPSCRSSYPFRSGLVLALALLLQASGYAQSFSEYQVKAAFLYRFVSFVEWSGNTQSGITICTLGSNPFQNQLEQMVQDKFVNGERISVRHVHDATAAQACQVVFIGASEKRRARTLLHDLANRQILTVGETDDFCQNGGVIGFAIVNGKVRFTINLDAAERAHLRISSRLLSVASIFREHGK